MKRLLIVVILLILTSMISYSQDINRITLINNPDCPFQFTEPQHDEEEGIEGMRVYFTNKGKKTIIGFKIRSVSYSMFKHYFDSSYFVSHNQNLSLGRKDYVFMGVASVHDPIYIKKYNNFLIVEELLFKDNTVWARKNTELFNGINEKMGSNFLIEDLVDNFGNPFEYFMTGNVVF